MLFGVEPADTLWGIIGSSLSGGCVDLLGVKSDVTAHHSRLNVGSSNSSLTIAMLDPSGWLTSIW